MTDELRLHSHLDANPGDGLTRLVLADLLESEGRDDEAYCQRWLAEKGLWPDDDLAFYGLKGWQWWASVSPDDPRAHARLPNEVHPWMPYVRWLYPTRQEAEAVLCRALASATESKKG